MAVCNHKPIYAGVVNIMFQKNVVGAIDVWVCGLCNELFCEEKRWGLTDAPKELGFTSSKSGSKWAVFICRCGNNVDWSLIAISSGDLINHRCPYSKDASFKVDKDFRIRIKGVSESEHSLHLVEQYINETIEV